MAFIRKMNFCHHINAYIYKHTLVNIMRNVELTRKASILGKDRGGCRLPPCLNVISLNVPNSFVRQIAFYRQRN